MTKKNTRKLELDVIKPTPITSTPTPDSYSFWASRMEEERQETLRRALAPSIRRMLEEDVIDVLAINVRKEQ